MKWLKKRKVKKLFERAQRCCPAGQRVLAGTYWKVASIGEVTQPDEAIKAYQELIQIEPNSVLANVHLGNVLSLKGQFDEAIDAYQEAIRLNNVEDIHSDLDASFKIVFDDAELYDMLAVAYFEKGLINEAITTWKKLIALVPDRGSIYLSLGGAYYRMEMYDEALTSLEEAARLNPDFPPIHIALGMVHATKGLHDEAIIDLKRAIKFDPSYSISNIKENEAFELIRTFPEFNQLLQEGEKELMKQTVQQAARRYHEDNLIRLGRQIDQEDRNAMNFPF